MGYFVKNRQLQSGSTGVVLPVGSSADRPNAPVFGLIRYNVDLGLIEFFDGTIFQQLSPTGNISYTVDNFTGDGITTTYTMSQGTGSASQIIVFIGSIYQPPNTYTLSGAGNIDITFSPAPPSGVPVNIIHSETPS
jgi:hypothetical protein